VAKPPQARRDDLVSAAVRLFQRQGFHQTTVPDIARAAEVATGTVYLYFPAKDEILLACHHRLRAGMAEQIAATASSALARVEAGQPGGLGWVVGQMVQAAADYAIANRDLCEVCMRYVAPSDPDRGDQLGLLQPLIEVLERGADQGLVRVADPPVTAQLLGAALGAALCGAVVYGSPPLERVLAAARELVGRALGEEPGR
jgi:AcrR family transcriptional regulator